jgi:hypothetical protein
VNLSIQDVITERLHLITTKCSMEIKPKVNIVVMKKEFGFFAIELANDL